MEKNENIIQEILQDIKMAKSLDDWTHINSKQTKKRLTWFSNNIDNLNLSGSDVRKAYTLLLIEYLAIPPEEVPVIEEDEKKIIWRSFNNCPVIEACRIGKFDTREICSKGYEKSVQELIMKINPKLHFSRNYDKVRPHSDYCEESIKLI